MSNVKNAPSLDFWAKETLRNKLREFIAHSIPQEWGEEGYRASLRNWSDALKTVAIETGVAAEDPGLFACPEF